MDKPYHYARLTDDISTEHAISLKPFNQEFHLHNGYEIYLFLDGDLNYFVEHSCYRLERGNILIFNNHEIHKSLNLTDKQLERFTIHFNPQILQRFSSRRTDLLLSFHNRSLGTNNVARLSEAQIKQYLDLGNALTKSLQKKGYGSDILPVTYLIQILAMINEIYSQIKDPVPSIISNKIESILLFIDEHINENLSLQSIAKELAMDKYYLSHIFRKETGSTLYQYILLKRVALSKQYLSEGRNVTEACMLSGFNDYANFIRTFKKITGVSPGKYSTSHH